MAHLVICCLRSRTYLSRSPVDDGCDTGPYLHSVPWNSSMSLTSAHVKCDPLSEYEAQGRGMVADPNQRHREHCRRCYVCQQTGPRLLRVRPRKISAYQPMAMFGMDFMSPIRPTSAKGFRYILLGVDYFTRFSVHRLCQTASREEVADASTASASSIRTMTRISRRKKEEAKSQAPPPRRQRSMAIRYHIPRLDRRYRPGLRRPRRTAGTILIPRRPSQYSSTRAQSLHHR